MTRATLASFFVTVSIVALLPLQVRASASPQQPPTITKERLTEEVVANLVSRAMGPVRSGDVSEGLRIFEAQLAALPPRSAERADLTMAFGVAIYNHGRERADVGLQNRAVDLLQNSVEAYRAAFGERHPEVAVALNSFADAARYLDAGDPPPSVDRSLHEAYDIRAAALGVDHPETLSTLVAIAEVDGLPSRTRGDTRRIDAVVATLQRISRTEASSGSGHAVSVAIAAAFTLPVIELANDRDAAARRHTRLAIDRAQTLQGPDEQVCSTLIATAGVLADALRAEDYEADAKDLVDRFVPPDAKSGCSPVGPEVI